MTGNIVGIIYLLIGMVGVIMESKVPGASEHSEYFKHVLNEILIH